jgi:hypothetical protein
MPALVTLTTNFGYREPSAAAVKGVLYAQCPGVQIENLGHELPRGDIMDSALFVTGAVPFFPPGTVHLVNVDPGPTPIAAAVADQYVVCPDNGVLTVLAEQHPITAVVAIALPEAVESKSRQVFYGREIFAPAAARLASGAGLDDLGTAIRDITRLAMPAPEKRDDTGSVRGEIIHIDQFGNLITNLHRSFLEDLPVSNIKVKGFRVGGVRQAYTDVESKKPLALFGSYGYLEIAYRDDRADARLRAGKGGIIEVELG